MGNFREEHDLLKTRVVNRFSELRNMQDIFEFVTQEEVENGEFEDYFDVTNDVTGDVFETTVMKVDEHGIKVHDIGNGTNLYVGLNDLTTLEGRISLVELMEIQIKKKESVTYFLFGSEAIRLYEEEGNGIDTLIRIKESGDFDVCRFVQNANPESLLSDFSGWQGFTVISQLDYEFLGG